MRLLLLFALVGVILIPGATRAQPPAGTQPSAGDRAAADKKLAAELAEKLAQLEGELAAVRDDIRVTRAQLALLRATPLTLDAAAESYRKDPARPVTVEIIAGEVSWLGDPPPDQCPPWVHIAVTADATPGAAAKVVRRMHIALTVMKPLLDLHPPVRPKEAPVRVLEPGEENPLRRRLLDLKGKTLRVTGTLEFYPAPDRPEGNPEGGSDSWILRVDGMEHTQVR